MNRKTLSEILKPGRHYGQSADGEVWVMVGCNLTEVETWSTVPPSASLTLAWSGGCKLTFDQGAFEVQEGDWMWIDKDVAHTGWNEPGSDFATLFFSERLVAEWHLDLAPIGANKQIADPDLALVFRSVAERVLAASEVAQSADVASLLDYVGTTFPALEPIPELIGAEDIVRARILSDPLGCAPLTDLGRDVDLSPSQLSKKFKRRFHLSPAAYRRQLRLALATRHLIKGHSVTCAATKSGFADAAHLSRVFKAQYGLSPSNWLAQLRGPRSVGKYVQDGITPGC